MNVYGYGNIFLLKMYDQEREGKLNENNKNEEKERMERYIVNK
jgi:hypothetical protein